MREYATPATMAPPAVGNLTDAVVENAIQAPDAVAFLRPPADASSEWIEVSMAQFLDDVRAVAKGLFAAGIEHGDRVALISRTRYEWTLLDYAIWWVGGVTVPVYETSAAPQMSWILRDSGAKAAIAEGAEHMSRLASIRSELDQLNHVWSFDDNAVEVLRRLGGDVTDDVLDERRRAVTPKDLATLLYTSGTTGQPKGCMLTHGNFLVELGETVPLLEDLFGDGASTLLFLPLAHVFARIVQVGCVQSRTPMAHSGDIARLLPHLAAVRPTFVLAVPRVFEKIFNTASQQAVADGRGWLFERAADAAIAYSRSLDEGRPSMRVRAEHAAYSRLVYQRLLESLGGRCHYAISGGAPLGEQLSHFFRGIGLTILEGYGLTETTAAVTVNLPGAHKIGTVGRPVPGATVRVADDGELVFRGGQVFSGYWNDESATAEVLDDGWFSTGDVGEVDAEGFVRITGRKKEILVTAGGKNVAPAGLENRIRAHSLVDQCLVVGDGRPFISALITLDHEAVAAWAERLGKKTEVDRLLGDADLQSEIAAAVDEANRSVSKAEAIRKFRVLASTWSEDGGQLTPSLKLKRNVVMREARAEIADLYLP